MKRTALAAALLLAAGLMMGACSHDPSKEEVNRRASEATDEASDAFQRTQRGARDAGEEAAGAVSDFIKGLRENGDE